MTMNPELVKMFWALNVPGFAPAPAPAAPAQTPQPVLAPAATTTLTAPQPASVPEGSTVVPLRAPQQASAPAPAAPAQTPAVTGFDRLKRFVDGLAQRVETLTSAFDTFKTSQTQTVNGLGVKLVRIEGDLAERVGKLEKRPAASAANVKDQLVELLKNPPAELALELRVGSERFFLEILEDRTAIIREAAKAIGVAINEADIRRMVKWQNFSADAVEKALATQKARSETSDVLDRMARQHEVVISRDIGRKLVDGVVTGEVSLDLLETAVIALAEQQHAAQAAVERRRQEDRRKQDRQREHDRTHVGTSLAGALEAAGFVANGTATPAAEAPPATPEALMAPEEAADLAGVPVTDESADAALDIPTDVDPEAAPPADKPAPRQRKAKPPKKGKARRDGEEDGDPADSE